jgi:hypothetical protein
MDELALLVVFAMALAVQSFNKSFFEVRLFESFIEISR